METLSVFRMDRSKPQPIGHINLTSVTFTYEPAYLLNPAARAISCSLPLREEPYMEVELIPYFEGLLPEGPAREAIAAALNIEPDNYLMLLLRCGLETIGDIAVTSGEFPSIAGDYRKLSRQNLQEMFSNMGGLAESNSEARLSLAGTQGKAGLAHLPDSLFDEGWLQPLEGAASTHILKIGSLPDIPFLEYLCLKAAAACGINTPQTYLLDFGKPVLCVERFDRSLTIDQGVLHVERFHQEDIAQALGISPKAKYRELDPSTAAVVANFLRSNSSYPIEDIESFANIICFNYLVGNCDNHLKNLSFLYGTAWKNLRLAPAYDLVSTTKFERFSRAMGMKIGDASSIDEVGPRDILKLSAELGISDSEIANVCRVVVEAAPAAIDNAAESLPNFGELPHIAWGLREDMADRLRVLERLA